MFLIKISGGIYQCVRYGIGVILRFAASPKLATGPKYDVIKMAAKLETLSELYMLFETLFVRFQTTKSFCMVLVSHQISYF